MLGRILFRAFGSERKTNLRHDRDGQNKSFAVDYEKLENRVVLATTFYFDFGAGLPAGGLNTDVTAFRDVAGANTGTDLALDAGMTAGDPLNIARLNYDYDGNGTPGEVSDVNALAAAALPLIQRALEPYDINAVIASASNLADVAATMALNAGDPGGQFDAYNFATTFTSTALITGANPTGSVGVFAGLFGLASRPDFNGAAGNFVDEATQSYADTIFASTPGTVGTAAFNANLAQRMAYTATHEGGHTIGFRHSTGLEAGGDIERLGSATRDFPFMLTRFDLNRTDGPAVVNTYDFIAADADMGLRDSDGDGIPDLAFASGTGAHDLIRLTSLGGALFMSSVDAFSDTVMTTLIGNETYNVSLVTDTEGTVLVDSGTNVDRVEIDASINADFRLRGGQGAEGTAIEADRLVIDVGGDNIVITAFAGGELSFQIAGGRTFDISEFEFIDLENVGAIEILGTNFDDVLNLSGTGNANEVAIDLNGNILTVQTNAILFTALGGNDQMIVDSTAGLVRLDNGVRYDGGGGFDRLQLTQTGGSQTSETIVVGATNGSGTDTIIGPGGTQMVQYENLEPIISNVIAASLSINGGTIGSLLNVANSINYAASNLFGAAWGMVTIDAFEPIHFINKTSLNIAAEAGSDLLNLNNPNTPTGLTNININGGPGATDQLHVIGTAGADTFTLTAGNLLFNSVNTSFTGIDSMLVAGRDNDDTFNVRATSIPTVLNGNGGVDTFNIASTAPGLSGNLDGISNELRIDAGSGANSLNVSDFAAAAANNAVVTSSSITGFAPATILYAATGGTMNLFLSGSDTQPDQFIVRSLLMGDSITIHGNGGNDRMVLQPGVLGNASLFGNAGNDIFRIELVGGGNRQVLASGGIGNDNLAVIGSSSSETFQLDAASLAANGEVVNFNTMEAMQVYGRDGDDTFNVNATSFFVLLEGGHGNDTFNITGAFPGGNLTNINAALTANGGSGNNSLNISNLTGPANNAFVTNAHIFGLAPAPINYSAAGGNFAIVIESSNNADNLVVVSLKASDSLTIDGNDGSDQFNVSSAALGNVVLNGNAGDDSFVVSLVGSGNRQVTVDGGGGTNPLSILGTSGSDVLHLHNPGVTRGNEDVNYSSISTLYVNTMNGGDVVNINTGAPITRVDAGEGNDYVGVNNTNGISNLTVNGDGGTDLLVVRRSNAPTYVDGGAGNDSINIGSTIDVNFGNLDLIKQVVIVNGGSGSDRLYLNDRAATGQFNYDVNPQWVRNTAGGPARAFFGVNYQSGIEHLRLDGTDQRNVFSVQPGFNTRYFIDGNLPSRNQVDAASQGDFLNLITAPNDGHNLQLTDRGTGTGFWSFTNGLNRVDFTEIEQFNHVGRLAIGSDTTSFNQLIVRDPETGNILFDIQPYENTFHGAVRVATGDINGDGIPDIITAPGPGRIATVKVFDGWDGSEISSFNAYASPMFDGLFVAVGNVTGNAAVDIVTSAGPGARFSEVQVFNNTNRGQTFTNTWSFLPYGTHASAGASVAVGDVNNDGYDDIITAPLVGRVQIAVFAGMAGNGPLVQLARFQAFGSDFYGGAFVTAGNYMGDGRADIIISGACKNTGSSQYSSLVQVFDGANLQNQPLSFIPADFSFKAFGDDRVSVRLAVKDHDLDGKIDELFAGQGPHGSANVIRVFQPLAGAVVDTVFEDFDGVFLG